MHLFFVCIFAYVCAHYKSSFPCTHTGLSSAWKRRSHEGNIELCAITLSANRSIGLLLRTFVSLPFLPVINFLIMPSVNEWEIALLT